LSRQYCTACQFLTNLIISPSLHTKTNVFDVSSTNTMFLIIIQAGYDEAKNLYKQRTVAKDPRSTLGWSERQEKKYLAALEKSRHCDAYWIAPNAEKTLSNH